MYINNQRLLYRISSWNYLTVRLGFNTEIVDDEITNKWKWKTYENIDNSLLPMYFAKIQITKNVPLQNP